MKPKTGFEKSLDTERRILFFLRKKGVCCTSYSITKRIKQNHFRVSKVLRDLRKRKVLGIYKSKGWDKKTGKRILKSYWGLK